MMEQMLDLPVQTAPLVHVTKNRIKNNSRKNSVPSRSHRKRNLISNTLESQSQNTLIEGISSKMEPNLPLKLPPPPVPKKPKMNIATFSNGARKSPPKQTILDAIQDAEKVSSIEAGSRSKPAIAPKPTIKMQNSLPVVSNLSNNKQRKADSTLNGMNDDKDNNLEKELNSPSKNTLSFSERLKASSLSRRKDTSTSNGFPMKSRSHIISPARRGSRTFISNDLSLEKEDDLKPKSSLPIFRRYSSETSLKSDDSNLETISDIAETGFDLDEFKNLSITPVEPLPVSSVLSPRNSFEEEDNASKDSFDTGELNVITREAPNLDDFDDKVEANSREVNIIKGSKEFNIASSSAGKTSVITPEMSSHLPSHGFSYHLQEDLEPSTVSETMSAREDLKQNGVSVLHEKSKKNIEDDINIIESSLSDKKLVVKDDFLNASRPERLQENPRNQFSSQKEHSINSKDHQKNGRRKFKPVGMNVKSLPLHGNKTEANVSKDLVSATQDVEQFQVFEQAPLDSSDSTLENVTQDPDLELSYEILVSPDEHRKETSITEKQDGKTVMDGPAFTNSWDTALITKESGGSTPLSWSERVPTWIENGEAQDKFQESSRFPETIDALLMGEVNISSETVPSLDVEMLPIVPPPPMDEDDMNSDEDMLFSIIDPPTVYEDDDVDDEMEIIPAPVQKNSEIIDNDRQDDKFSFPNDAVTLNAQTVTKDNFVNSFDQGFDETDFVTMVRNEDKALKDAQDFSKENHMKDDGVGENGENRMESIINRNFKPTITEDNYETDAEKTRTNVLSLAQKFESICTDKSIRNAKTELQEFGRMDQAFSGVDSNDNKLLPEVLKADDQGETLSRRSAFDSTVTSEEFSSQIVSEDIISSLTEAGFEEAAFPFDLLNTSEELSSENGMNNLVSLPEGISEVGKQRKKSFSDRSTPVDISDSLKSFTESGELDQKKLTAADLPQDKTTLHGSSDFSTQFIMPSDDMIPDQKLSWNSSTEENRLEKVALEFSSIPVVQDISDLPGNPSALSDTIHPSVDLSPKVERSKNSILEELLDPAEPNKLSPWSSFEYLPDSGRPSSRKSSIGSSNKSGTDNDASYRNPADRRWSSFGSSSGDEQENDKKINIAQLLRERTLIQTEVASDVNNETVQLNFEVSLTSDDKYENNSEIDSNDDQLEDAYDSKLDAMPLDEWTIEDVGDWLEMIGLVELRTQFEEKKICGRELLAIDLQLLDDMGISNIEDRELILSEIYALKNPEDMDIEMSLLDALDNASGYDREKMLAVLEALKMSTEDQENHYLPSPSPKLSAGSKQKSKKSKNRKENYRRAVSEYSASRDEHERHGERSKSVSPTRNPSDVQGHSIDSPSISPTRKKEKKGSKKKSFLREAFSFRRKGSGRIARLFSSRKKLVDSSLKYLLQSSPQGIVKVLTHEIKGELGLKGGDDSSVSLLVTSTTAAADVTKTVLEKLDMIEDVNCFYLVQSHSSKSVPEIVLRDDDCPLVLQCRWPDAERYKFELKKKPEGSVIIVSSEDDMNNERSVKIETMMKTTCAEIISIALKKLQKNEPAKSFSLYQIKNAKQGYSNGIQEAQIPTDASLLQIAPSISRPAVYKLVRVNFLGSPEKTFKLEDGQREIVERLESQLKEKNEQLSKANESNASAEKKLKELTENNDVLKKKMDFQDKQLIELENIAESLRLEVEQQNEGSINETNEADKHEIENLSQKLEEKTKETKSLKESIATLKSTFHEKQEEVQRFQRLFEENEKEKSESAGNGHVLEKLRQMEEENQLLKRRIVQVENQALDKSVGLTEQNNQLLDQNEELQKMVRRMEQEELARNLENERMSSFEEEKQRLNEDVSELKKLVEIRDTTIASLRDLQREKELMDDKVQSLQNSLAKKDEKLRETEQVDKLNEALQEKVIALERAIKQKDRMINDASTSQREMMELRRKLESVSEEVVERNQFIEKLSYENMKVRKEMASELEQKENAMGRMEFEINDLRRKFSESDEERKVLKSMVSELEQSLLEKDGKLEEISEVYDEYKGQHEKVKKLERELTLRSDELDQVNKEKEISLEDLRNHVESLEQNLIDKDAKHLDLEFKLQKSERSLREAENLCDDEIREKSRLKVALDDTSHQIKELSKKLEDYKRLIAEKDKIIQNLKGNQAKADENLRRELSNAQRTLMEKDSLVLQIRSKIDEERTEMKSRFETLQELVTVKEAKWKEKEARMIGEKNEQRSQCTQLEEKLNAKDDHVRKLEAKVAKLEKIARENMKKFEKFMSDKDRMLRQVREESQKDVMDLKSKLRQMDDALTQKEKHVLHLNRNGSFGKEFEVKLKQKEEENKQHKFLLERLMSVVNDKDPGILEEFENSFGKTGKSDKQPLLPKADEDWC